MTNTTTTATKLILVTLTVFLVGINNVGAAAAAAEDIISMTTTTAAPNNGEMKGGYTPIESACLCTEFRCSDGSACLHKSRVCNGYGDCPSGEDEMLHTLDPSAPCVRKNPSSCNSSVEFRCKFGGCIDVRKVCDGVPHCFGGVDEASDLCTYLFST